MISLSYSFSTCSISVVSASVHNNYVLNFNETGGATSQLSEAKIRVTIDVWVIHRSIKLIVKVLQAKARLGLSSWCSILHNDSVREERYS